MGERPKGVQRPWLTKIEYNKMPGQGRRVVSKFYNTSQWRKLSKAWRESHPLCVECEKMGLLNRGNVTDHIKPINPENAWDLQGGKYGKPVASDNLQTLCTFHHNQKSGRERHQQIK